LAWEKPKLEIGRRARQPGAAARAADQKNMPIYEFECPACSERFDRLQRLSDPDPNSCPNCGATGIRRRLTAPSFRLAGSGWYETDFKKDGDKKRNLAEKADAAKSDGNADGKPEAKSEARSDAKSDATSGKADAAAKREPSASTKTDNPKSAQKTPVDSAPKSTRKDAPKDAG
jgi:putative FmdB family regulatory protein